MGNVISQYQIKTAVVSAERYGTSWELEISNLIFEANFYENIMLPYITGQIFVVDKGKLFEQYLFNGSERIYIEVAGKFGDKDDFPIKKSFIIRGVSVSAGNNTSYLFDLIEEHGFLGTTKVISKSYTGSYEEIVEKIIKGQLNRNIDIRYMTPSMQGIKRYIVPYLRVLDAARNITKGMRSQYGTPYFLYSSLYSPDIRLGSFEKMINVPAFNVKAPYIYTSAHTSGSHEDPNDFRQMFIIESYDINSKSNEHVLAQLGANGSRWETTDLNSTDNFGHHVSGRQNFNILHEKTEMSDDVSQNVIDGNFKINDQYLEDIDSRVVHRLTSSNTFLDYEVKGQNLTESSIKSKSFSNTLRHMLENNSLNVVIPGSAITISRVSAGDNIRLYFRKEDSTETKYDDIYDRELTGDYFITNIRHIMSEGRHTVALTVTKIVRDFRNKFGLEAEE